MPNAITCPFEPPVSRASTLIVAVDDKGAFVSDTLRGPIGIKAPAGVLVTRETRSAALLKGRGTSAVTVGSTRSKFGAGIWGRI